MTLKDPAEPAPAAETPDAEAFGADKPDRGSLASALEAWLGPVADGIAAVTALSDEELDRELRNNLPEIERKASEADLEGLQQLMAGDMRRRYENQV